MRLLGRQAGRVRDLVLGLRQRAEALPNPVDHARIAADARATLDARHLRVAVGLGQLLRAAPGAPPLLLLGRRRRRRVALGVHLHVVGVQLPQSLGGALCVLEIGIGVSGDCGVVRPERVPWAIRALVNCAWGGRGGGGAVARRRGVAVSVGGREAKPCAGLSRSVFTESSESSSDGLEEAFLMTRGEGERAAAAGPAVALHKERHDSWHARSLGVRWRLAAGEWQPRPPLLTTQPVAATRSPMREPDRQARRGRQPHRRHKCSVLARAGTILLKMDTHTRTRTRARGHTHTGALLQRFGAFEGASVALYERMRRRKVVSTRHTGQCVSCSQQLPQTTWWPHAIAARLRGASMHMMQAVSCVVARAPAAAAAQGTGLGLGLGSRRRRAGERARAACARARRASSSAALQALKRSKAA